MNECPKCGGVETDCFDSENTGSEVIEHYSCEECSAQYDVYYVFDRVEVSK